VLPSGDERLVGVRRDLERADEPHHLTIAASG
jgi:hypothetical protein